MRPLLPPKKHLSLLPDCTGVLPNTLIYPYMQGEHPRRGDGDPTGVKVKILHGNKVHDAGANGAIGGTALYHSGHGS